MQLAGSSNCEVFIFLIHFYFLNLTIVCDFGCDLSLSPVVAEEKLVRALNLFSATGYQDVVKVCMRWLNTLQKMLLLKCVTQIFFLQPIWYVFFETFDS